MSAGLLYELQRLEQAMARRDLSDEQRRRLQPMLDLLRARICAASAAPAS